MANISETETLFSKEHIFFTFLYLEQLANKKVLSRNSSSSEHQPSNPPRPPLLLFIFAFLSYKFLKLPKTLSKTCLNILFSSKCWTTTMMNCGSPSELEICLNILFSSNQKTVKWLNKWYFLKMKSVWSFSYFSRTDTF